MKSRQAAAPSPKELYSQLRALTWRELWSEEVAQFNEGSERERFENVAVIRAVGVVFSESGPPEQRGEVRQWLRRLLQDPQEKIRRYAMAAMPKIGAGESEEAELITLLKTTTVDREKKYLGKTLDKIGGTATLASMDAAPAGLRVQTEQKVKASLARSHSPSTIRMDSSLADAATLRINLRGRSGLERIVREEVEAAIKARGQFRITDMGPGLIALAPVAAFTLGDLFALRCFGTVSFVLGSVEALPPSYSGARAAPPSDINTAAIESIAKVIASPLSRNLFKTFTQGSQRYRLNFVDEGHKRGAVRLVANRAYELCSDILNDAREAPWSIDIHPTDRGYSVELSPRISPDPRLFYRQDDVPAASHPPLAACMARLAGRFENEIVWDPFCGSGLELVERALLGGVSCVFGTDRSSAAIAIAQANLAAAKVKIAQTKFTCCDFRDHANLAGFGPNSCTLIITNPPMGKRVPIGNLRGLIDDLFALAATVLKPGGRLVFANPLPSAVVPSSLKLQSKQIVDFNGFDCRLEKYVKAAK